MAEQLTLTAPKADAPPPLCEADLALIAVATRVVVARAPSWAELESARRDVVQLLPAVSSWHPRLGTLPEACAGLAEMDFADPAALCTARWARVEYELAAALARIWRARAAAAMERLQREAAA